MSIVKIKFVATETRSVYNCANVMMHDGDVVALDDEEYPKEVVHFLEAEKDSGNFEQAPDGASPTVTWEDTPIESNPVKQVEVFLIRWRSDSKFRETALSRGVRVLDVGQVR